jgi:hypothetical protein
MLARLVVATAIVVFLLPGFAASAQTGLDRPLADVQADLGKTLRCKVWSGTATRIGCRSALIAGAIFLDRASDGSVAKLDMNAALRSEPSDVHQDAASRHAMHELFGNLFPQWDERRAWLDLALDAARDRAAKSTIVIETVGIVVEPFRFADIPGLFVSIVMSGPHAAADEHRSGDR